MAKKSRSALTTQAQQIQTEVSDKANTNLRIGTMDQDLLDSLIHQDDPAVFTSVDTVYADIPAMLANQGLQTPKNFYRVDNAAADSDLVGYAYYEYLGGTTVTMADYKRVATQSFNYADFTVTSAPTYSEGRVFYDGTKKNFVFMNDRTEPRLDVGRETWTRAVNKTGTGTTNGKAVYITGSTGNLPNVELAKSDIEGTSEILGVYTEDVVIDDNGEVTSFGLVNDVATGSWGSGDVLYLDASTAGDLTNVKPDVPNFVVPVGIVVKSHASEGIIWINIGHIEPPIHRSINSAWSAFSGSTAATNYLKGYYTFESAVTPAGGTTLGGANLAYDAHVYFVLGVTSTDMVIRVSGTSYDDETGRTATDTEDIDTSGGVLDDYFETTKKWIGQISFALQSGTGVIAAYGWAAYWDNRNTKFVISALEWVGRAGANDTAPNIRLWHHKLTGWTYGVGGATPPTALVDMQSEFVTEYQFGTGQYFKFKKIGLSQLIDGTTDEGIIIGIDITANNAIANSNVELQIIGS